MQNKLQTYQFVGSVKDYQDDDGRREIRVLFRRGSLRDGSHVQGRQQARKLPTRSVEAVMKRDRTTEGKDVC